MRFLLLAAVMFICSCASIYSSLVSGGRIVNAGYSPQKLVAYEAEKKDAFSGKYYLVMDNGKLAMFEEVPGKMSTVIDLNRHSELGDHFVIWVNTAQAGEIVVPSDRTKPAQYYLFQPGTYRIQTIDGVERPVPLQPQDPFTTLVPIVSR